MGDAARAAVRVKICGLCRPEDARLAAEAGADFLGVVLAPGPRRQDVRSARRIWGDLPVARAAVFADTDESEVCRAADRLGLSVVQLHGSEPPEFCGRVRGAGPWQVWKAVRIREGERLPDLVGRFGAVVDAVLVEPFSEHGLGGMGAPLHPEVVAGARRAWPPGLALVVAGGLRPENVTAVVRSARPHVVDVSSGVEARIGVKDPEKVRAFIRNARSAG
ncbi:MAG: phosphoribosylanthranilate isomerase [Gemmatimonadetes bacterium]|nr:phosphoribosylanthranilate isomerase [Gemmatimonadota bacterium]